MLSTGAFGVATLRKDAPKLHWDVTPIRGERATMIGRAVFKGDVRSAIDEAQSAMTSILARG
jgi:hypothetical protein